MITNIVRASAWDRVGADVKDLKTSEEVIKSSNLDYKVKLAKIYTTLPSEGRNINKSIDNINAIYRKDNNDIFGVVSDKYSIVQNTEGFKFFDSIVENKQAIYTSAGVLEGGRIVFIIAKLPNYIRMEMDKEDIIEKYLLLSMGHDGKTSIQALFVPSRVICRNVLTGAIDASKNKDRIRIIHKSSAQTKLQNAATVLQLIDIRSEEIQVMYNALAKTRIDSNNLQKYIAKLFLKRGKEYVIEQNKVKLLTGEDGISTRTYNIINKIETYTYVGTGQDRVSSKGTLFGAYNGISYYFQNIKNYNTDGINNDEKYFTNTLLKGGKDISNKAFKLAIQAMENIEVLNN